MHVHMHMVLMVDRIFDLNKVSLESRGVTETSIGTPSFDVNMMTRQLYSQYLDFTHSLTLKL